MTRCHKCKKSIIVQVFHCRHCKHYFCSVCRHVRAHQCQGVVEEEPELPATGFARFRQLLYEDRRLQVLVVLGGVFLLYFVGFLWVFSDTHIRPVEQNSFEFRVFELVNQERGILQLEPLLLSGELANIARNHSRDMAANDYFSVLDRDGGGFVERWNDAGFSCATVGGENIALLTNLDVGVSGGTLAKRAVSAMMARDEYHDNIVHEEFTSVGVGARVVSGDRIYVTVDFC